MSARTSSVSQFNPDATEFQPTPSPYTLSSPDETEPTSSPSSDSASLELVNPVVTLLNPEKKPPAEPISSRGGDATSWKDSMGGNNRPSGKAIPGVCDLCGRSRTSAVPSISGTPRTMNGDCSDESTTSSLSPTGCAFCRVLTDCCIESSSNASTSPRESCQLYDCELALPLTQNMMSKPDICIRVFNDFSPYLAGITPLIEEVQTAQAAGEEQNVNLIERIAQCLIEKVDGGRLLLAMEIFGDPSSTGEATSRAELWAKVNAPSFSRDPDCPCTICWDEDDLWESDMEDRIHAE